MAVTAINEEAALRVILAAQKPANIRQFVAGTLHTSHLLYIISMLYF